MAYERPPDDFTRSPDDPYIRRQPKADDDLRMDPELATSSANGVKLALLAIAVVVVLGAVFYGLNSPTNRTGTHSTAQTTPSSPPAAPPGMRDVTPGRPNTNQGVTTGSAPPSPQTPPAAAPASPSGNPPAANGQNK